MSQDSFAVPCDSRLHWLPICPNGWHRSKQKLSFVYYDAMSIAPIGGYQRFSLSACFAIALCSRIMLL